MLFKVEKIIGSIPVQLSRNTLYFVRTRMGFDIFLSDSTGNIAHKINTPELDATEIFLNTLINDGDIFDIGDNLAEGLNKIQDAIKTISVSIANMPKIYDATGLVQNPKIFTSLITTSAEGTWTANYAHVGFTKILGASVISIANGDANASRTLACVNQNGIGLTTCTGHYMSATSAGLLAAMTLINASGSLYLTIIGI